MYVKTTSRKVKGGEVRYLHLAHSEWDAAARRSVPKLLYSFGREDQLDKEAVRRLVGSLAKLLDPAELVAATPADGLVFTQSRPYGGAYVLDALWHRLGIDTILTGLRARGRGRPRDGAAAERVVFGLAANRALAPSSKLAAAEWMSRDVHIDGLDETSDDACCRAMDWLHAVRGRLERQVYDQVADLLNLEVDLLFFDTTSTCFELDEADEAVLRNWRGEKAAGEDGADPDKTAGFRTHGKSKDSRDDLPQIVIGLAVTRGGIPVRVWCWPGNTADSALIRQVKDDMRDWSLARIIWVADRGFFLRGEPPLPAARCRALHHRGEASLRVSRSAGCAVPAGPLPAGGREPASQGSPPRRGRGPVRDLLQPRGRGPRRCRPRGPGRQAGRDDHRHRCSQRHQAG